MKPSDAYDMIDRFLRNNLDDDDYAEYSNALEILCNDEAAVLVEREQCAKVCEKVEGKPEYLSVAKLCAAAIRARS